MKVIVKRVTTDYYEYNTISTDYKTAKQEVIDCIEMIGIEGTTAEPVDTMKVDYIDGEEIEYN
jgi:hypothetical protein